LACLIGGQAVAAVVNHSGTLSAHTTWSSGDVHRITGDVTVPAGIILTVESGAVVKFNSGFSLFVSGALDARGATGNEVIFTSYRDDSVGGDTNGDGPSQGAPGDWGRIYINDTVTESLTFIENVAIRYGGRYNQGNLYLFRANVSVVNSEVSQGSHVGIHSYQSAPRIEGSTIADNASIGIYDDRGSALIRGNTISRNLHGVYAQYATPTLEDNQIKDNREWGVYHVDYRGAPLISGNTITGNKRAARLPLSAVPNVNDDAVASGGNVLVPNEINGLWILGGGLTRDLTLGVQSAEDGQVLNRYQFDTTLTVNSGVRLTLAPGVALKFAANTGLTVHGTLDAVGTAGAPIAFTSHRDDAYGGDFNADGYASQAANGDWQGLYFSDQSSGSVLEQAVVRYGGSSGNGNVYAYRSAPQLTQVELSHSSTNGLRVYQASPVLTGVMAWGNAGDGLRFESSGSPTVTASRIYANFDDGVEVTAGANVSVTGSEVFANAGYGIRNAAGNAHNVEATDNWWGAVDGPGGSYGGSGDEISEKVVIAGLLGDDYRSSGTAFSYFNAGSNTSEGSLAGPSVPQGTASTEFGTAATQSLLYDFERVILEYGTLAASGRYDLLVTYYNPDDTAGIGGTVQRLTDGVEQAIHGAVVVPRGGPVLYRYALAPEAYSGNQLRLNFIRENGYRATVSQVWLVARDGTDTTAPSAAFSAPAAGAHLNGGEVLIRGSASDATGSGVLNVEFGVSSGSGPIAWHPVSQLDGDANWWYRWSLPADGSYTLHARATDWAGNTQASPSTLAVVVNQAPPVAVTAVSVHDTPQDSGGSISLSWTPSTDDGAGSNDVAGYLIERRALGGAFAEQGSVVAGISAFADAAAVTGTDYEYRVVAVDLAGNRAPSGIYGPVAAIDNTLSDVTPPEEVTNLSGTPGSGLVYLSWTRSVDSARDLVDQALDISGDGGATWGTNAPAYNDGTTLSLGQATDHYLATGLNNGTGYRFRIRTQDGASPANLSAGAQTGNLIPSDTAYTTVSGTLSADTTWAVGVYHVNGDLTVPAGVTLRIEPGVIVKFGGSRRMTVNGTLLAQGREGTPVVFTAFSDDQYGGDTNDDGPSAGAPGYWSRISLEGGASSGSRIEHAVIRYGGAYNSGTAGTVYLYQSNATVLNSIISDGSHVGIHSNQSSPTIEGNTIIDHASHGIYSYLGSLLIKDNTISRNANGIYAHYSTPRVDGNTITDNTGYGFYNVDARSVPEITGNTITGNNKPARLPASALPGPEAGNTLVPNTLNQLEILGNGLARDVTLSSALVYHQLNGTVGVTSGATLRLQPGVIWKFGVDARMTIAGALNAIGTAENKIVFTSYRDDSVGGDTNGDGPSQGAPGDWARIYFQDSVIDFLTRLEHTVVRYGGRSNEGNLYLFRANVSVVNSEVSQGSHVGIHSYQSAPRIEGSTIADNASIGIYDDRGSALIRGNTISRNLHGVYAQYATPTLEDNQIKDNREWGVYHVDYRGAPLISGNTITGNKRAARLPLSAVPNVNDDAVASGGNVLVPNEINGLWILGGGLTRDLTLGVQSAEDGQVLNRYQFDTTLTVNSGVRLTLAPGVALKFAANTGLTVHGTLDAVGTAGAPIAFTSHRDDAYGGDFNADGYASQAANGDWQGLYFSDQSSGSVLEQAVVRYGGSSGNGNVYAYRSAPQLTQVELSHSSTNGLRVYQASPVLTGVMAWGNAGDGLRFESSGSPTVTASRIYANFDDGVEVTAGANVSVTGSEVFANAGYGIRNAAGNAHNVEATDNWWGAVDGPGGSYGGSGDEISEKVVIAGPLGDDYRTDGTEYSYFDAGGTYHYGYNIITPKLTGTASSEWGSAPYQTFLHDIGNKSITADYSGLSDAAAYLLVVTYLSNDAGGTVQKLTTGNGMVIHEPVPLPITNPTRYAYLIPRGAIVSGNLSLNFTAVSGPRALVSDVHLLKLSASEMIPPVVQIDAPINGQLLGAGEHLVGGSATDADSSIMAVEVGVQANGGPIQWHPVSTLSTTGQWFYRWDNPVSGSYTLHVRATDEAGNRTTTGPLNVTVDTAAPAAVAGVGVEQGSGVLSVLWTRSADDGAGSNDVARYEVYRSDGALGSLSKLGEVPAGTTRFDDSSVVADVVYYYMVRTVDQASNGSDSIKGGPYLSSDVADTTAPEDIGNFAATAAQDGSGNVSAYLTWSGSTNSEGDLREQRLYLSIDGGASFGNNAPVYNNGGYFGLNKDSRNYQVTGLTANQTYTFKLTTVDEVPNESPGVSVSLTPTGSSSEYVSLNGTFSTDTTLKAGVFVVTGDLTIPVGVTLRIEPGVIVKFGGSRRMTVNGTLLAQGQNGNPVVFTSFSDDQYGGDTNGNGPSTGTPGYWSRISLEGAASSGSRIEQAVIRYGGAYNAGTVGTLYLYQSSATVLNSSISDGSHIGIYSRESAPTIEGNTVIDHASHGIYAYHGSLLIKDNIISRNAHGIYARYSTPTIEDNQITDNSNHGIYFYDARDIHPIVRNTITGNNVSMLVPASGLPDDTNTVTPNTLRYIGIHGNTIQSDTHLRAWAQGMADEVREYVVYGSNNLHIPQFLVLTVDPGVIVKFSGSAGISVDGALVADGSVEEKIIFTSIHDDTAGGDTNGNGSDTAPVNGNWGGITFGDSLFDVFSVVDHVKVRYAGSNGSGALYFYRSDITVENSEISNSSTNGIRIYEASPAIIGSRIWGNAQDGIRVERAASNPTISFNRISTNLSDGIEVVDGARATATNNQIFVNRAYGLRNSTGNVIDASQSWWGDADGSGPYHGTTNALGTGNQVSDNVTYAPYQTTVGTEFSYKNLSAAASSSSGPMAEPVLIQGVLSDEWAAAGQHPDRTMAWDAERVILDYSGLDPAKRYKIRISYFNGDTAAVLQSIVDGADNPVHPAMQMPTGSPVQYEFSIPQAYYGAGDLRLQFIHDNLTTSLRAAVPEVWLMEEVIEFTPPKFESVAFNDVDGSGTLSVGDEYHFNFSEPMDTSGVADGTTDANTNLAPTGNLAYGTTNQSRWSADETTVIVTVTEGFTITGMETVTPVGLKDKFNNFTVGSQTLTLNDTVAPALAGIDWLDSDNSTNLTLGDRFVFRFSEAMDTIVVNTGTTQANAHLWPEGGMRYGDLNIVTWSVDRRELTVEVTAGFTIKGDERVIPSSFVTDVGGNSVTGTGLLAGRDYTPPSFLSVKFDDANGDGGVSVGDSYAFTFNEPMIPGSLSNNTTEANANLSPAGLLYGTVNRINWNTTFTQVTVFVTEGFTISGSEVVTPSLQLTDTVGNSINNTVSLTLSDTVQPRVIDAHGNMASPVQATDQYRVILQFSGTVETTGGIQVAIVALEGTSPTVAGGGAWSTTVHPNDTYTTPPITLTTAMKGTLRVDVSGVSDVDGNLMDPATNAYSFELQADPPAITNHPIAPTINYVPTNTVTLEGMREDNTSIWINDMQIAAVGSGPWNTSLTLNQGANDVVVHARDAGGNRSASVTVRFFVDSIAPVISGITPASNSYLNSVPSSVLIGYTESGSGLDLGGSTVSVARNGVPLTGVLSSSSTKVVFTPDIQFVEGVFQITAQLRDAVGLQSAPFAGTFTIDQMPPVAPVVNEPPAVTNINQQLVSGTKEAYSAIQLNSQQVVSNTAGTSWSYTVPLATGLNTLSFTARDQAGNESVPSVVRITFDNTAPGPVPVTADGVGDGTRVTLDWSGYDEVANGNDIQHYTVYIAAAPFANTAAATALTTVPAGQRSYTADGLERGQAYYFAVVASDTLNNAVSSVTPVSVTPADSVAPAEVTNLQVDSFADRLTVNWTASGDTDVAGYRVYVDANPPVELGAGTTGHSITGLSPASGHAIRVTVFDPDGNESAGVDVTGVTL
ncbi:right-handed parallel beta-helix repeat-containing protein, partial [Sedimenticola hydrogenitrophicus]|uniref:right-handed parallel beta-helix repeat-containing protein n=1 Tax=Sedimenticola hydrogenitrophicus TaxID=2967975 RepID=UPI0023AE6CAC